MTRRYQTLTPIPPPWTWVDWFYVLLATLVGIVCFLFLSLIFLLRPADATYKPEYGKNPQAVQDWFRAQLIMPDAAVRLGYSPGVTSCCDHADRLFTKFVGTGQSDWKYYVDPNCTHSGCKLIDIPNDTIHPEEIRALKPKDDALPEFEAMRREGVLMIYAGSVTCFWPPESSI